MKAKRWRSSDSETKTQLKSMSSAQCRNPQMAIYWAGCLRGIPLGSAERRLAARVRGRVICRNGQRNSWRLPEQIAQPRLRNYRHISLLVSLHGGDPFCIGFVVDCSSDFQTGSANACLCTGSLKTILLRIHSHYDATRKLVLEFVSVIIYFFQLQIYY